MWMGEKGDGGAPGAAAGMPGPWGYAAMVYQGL
jgi:hypothetical protein